MKDKLGGEDSECTRKVRWPEEETHCPHTVLVKMMTEFFLSMHRQPAHWCPSSGTAEEKDESALSLQPSSLPLSLHISVLLHLFSDLSGFAVQHIEVTSCSSTARRDHAGRSCCIIQPWQEVRPQEDVHLHLQGLYVRTGSLDGTRWARLWKYPDYDGRQKLRAEINRL